MSKKEIDIKAWAQRIRKLKICELGKIIENAEKLLKKHPDIIFKVNKSHECMRIPELKKKLEVLKTK